MKQASERIGHGSEASKQKRTQHSHNILQQGHRILALDKHHDQSDMNYIVFANEMLRKGCKGVQDTKRYVLREPTLVRELGRGNIEAVELRRSGHGASGLDQPYSSAASNIRNPQMFFVRVDVGME